MLVLTLNAVNKSVLVHGQAIELYALTCLQKAQQLVHLFTKKSEP